MMHCNVAIFLLIIVVLTEGLNAFSVGRSARNTDLADALSVLQRQRRDPALRDPARPDPALRDPALRDLSPRYARDAQYRLHGRALRSDDIREWLNAGVLAGEDPGYLAGDGTMDDPYGEWVSGSEPMRRQLTREDLIYQLPELFEDQSSLGDNKFVTEASKSDLDEIFEPETKSELDAVFDDDAKPTFSKKSGKTPTKKNKEEALNVAVNHKKVIKKKSVNINQNSIDDISLDSLTQDEIQVLMKAVKKLKVMASIPSKEEGSNNIKGNIKQTLTILDPSGAVVDREVDESPIETNDLDDIFDEVESEGNDMMNSAIGEENKQPEKEKERVVSEEQLSKLDMSQSSGPEGTITRTVETHLGPSLSDQNQLSLNEDFLSDIDRGLDEAEEVDLENQIKADEEATDAIENAVSRVENAIRVEQKLEQKQQEVAEPLDNKVENIADDSDTALIHSKLLKDIESKYQQMQKLLNNEMSSPAKRTAKRSALYSDEFADQMASEEEDDTLEPEILRDLRHGQVAPVGVFVQKILALQAELDRLRTVVSLEDFENDQLTDALNEATRGQMRSSVSGTELSALQRAIRIEEAIQDIQTSSGAPLSAPPMQTAQRKRGEPWRRKRGMEPEGVDDVDDLLPAFMDNRVSTVSPDDIEKAIKQAIVKQSQAQAELTPRLTLAPSREAVSLFDSGAGQCPAVRRYSSDCHLAKVFHLPVDAEARALCNLHEMCYACGATLSVDQSECDLMYKVAAEKLCQDGERCLLEAEVFLSTMRLKHRFTSHPQPLCDAPCTARYLGLA